MQRYRRLISYIPHGQDTYILITLILFICNRSPKLSTSQHFLILQILSVITGLGGIIRKEWWRGLNRPHRFFPAACAGPG